jgi:hypothetical protein
MDPYNPYSPYNNEEGMNFEAVLFNKFQGNFLEFLLVIWKVYCSCPYSSGVAHFSKCCSTGSYNFFGMDSKTTKFGTV